MKLAVLSESETDEAIVRMLVDAILARPTEAVDSKSLRRRAGVSSIERLLPPILKELHFRTDADCFAVVVDSNSRPIHEHSHDTPNGTVATCRLCKIRTQSLEIVRQLPPGSGRPPLKIAVGQASPALEAWLLCDTKPECSESALQRCLHDGNRVIQIKRDLKQQFSGVPGRNEAMIAAARRVASNLDVLRENFPGGFGAFERQVRSWLTPEECA